MDGQIVPLRRTRAQESRAAIERLYIMMRHLVNRGYYKPFGRSGIAMTEALGELKPEIYGFIDDPEKVELDGLVYVVDRLPRGIEECRFIRLISEEGYEDSSFEVITAAKRRLKCYRVGSEEMLIEITRGRSEIYDLLTHLTFFYMEAEKIRSHALDENGNYTSEWLHLERAVGNSEPLEGRDLEHALSHLSALLGRTFEETRRTWERLSLNADKNSGLFSIIHGMGRLAIEERRDHKDREVSFSPALRERIGHHIYGERWAAAIKKILVDRGLHERPLHIVSANLHSIMNTIYARAALKDVQGGETVYDLALILSERTNEKLQERVRQYAEKHGMFAIPDRSGTNLNVQLFDFGSIDPSILPPELNADRERLRAEKPVVMVMDYAFGEQAYEVMDELLRPCENGTGKMPMNVQSISIMGKAGVLQGAKGDIVIPIAHVFEGTADNYPIENEFTEADFDGHGLSTHTGPMLTVLGTSLQNSDILSYFKNSSWKIVGLEMEGAHYQKAIQSASRVRNTIRRDVVLRYAYYASDNPLLSGETLASGSLGPAGVKPTYLITLKILEKVLGAPRP